MKLAIISHTEHYNNYDGSVLGWGPTIREINHMAPHFEKVYHVACLHDGPPPPSSLKYTESNIEFVPIPPFGGNNLSGKLTVLITMPEVIKQVSRIIKQVDYFQLRLPTGFGNYLLPWLKLFKPKAKFWVKYAGNWVQKRPDLGYAFQRWWLKNNFSGCKVTINGHWRGQSAHLLSFENPCLTEQEIYEGRHVVYSKEYGGTLDFVFVGNLNESKGVRKILEALHQLKENPRIGMLHLIGDGFERKMFEKLAKEVGIRSKFYGFLPKDEVNEVLSKSHILLLPSESEGFPKVVAESSNFGCIPIVSDISCISQYINNGENGFLMKTLDVKGLRNCIENLLTLNSSDCQKIAIAANKFADKFTYESFTRRLLNEILI